MSETSITLGDAAAIAEENVILWASVRELVRALEDTYALLAKRGYAYEGHVEWDAMDRLLVALGHVLDMDKHAAQAKARGERER